MERLKWNAMWKAIAVGFILTGVAFGYGRQTREKGVPGIQAANLGKKYVVMGDLGKPLGEFMTIGGSWVHRESVKYDTMFFRVTQVNGEALDKVVEFPRGCVKSVVFRKTEPKTGDRWELRVYEGLELSGIPDGYWVESGERPGSGEREWKFVTTIHCVRHTQLK